MSRVAVSTDVLKWALDRSNQPADSLIVRFPKILEWLSGDSQPTLKQLEEFAIATFTPFGFLFLQEPPEEKLPIPHFRTLGDEIVARPSPNLIDTVYAMQRRQDWMRAYLIDEGHDPLPFISSITGSTSFEDVAYQMRVTFDLDSGWASRLNTWQEALDSLCSLLEESGILVVVNGVVGNNTHRTLDPAEFRGFVLSDDYAPLVFVNNSDSKAAQMFTLAHELAHLFYGSSAAFDLRLMQPAKNRGEIACNKAAAEFLVPENNLRSLWSKLTSNPNRYNIIARNFKVSEIVAARRALDLNLIAKDEFFEFYNAYIADERRRKYSGTSGGNFYNNQNRRVGKRFATAVVSSVKEGKLLYSEAYRLTGLKGKAFDVYASSLGFGEFQ